MTISTASPERAGSTVRRRSSVAAQLSEPDTDTRPAAITATGPAAIAVDLGSGQARVWTAENGERTASATSAALGRTVPLLRRGRIVDDAGCVALLTRLLEEHHDRPAGPPVVVACRPVLTTADDQARLRQVLTAAFAPARILLLDTVLAAAMGAGAASGVLLVVDIGEQLTEVAMIANNRVVAARRVDLGTGDLDLGVSADLLADIVTRLVAQLEPEPGGRRPTTPPSAVLVVGGGANTARLTRRLAADLHVPVRRVPEPLSSAVTGAGRAALAAVRHPALG
ncbi:rod shape-determining protein [Micromonospora sp. NPDC003197]